MQEFSSISVSSYEAAALADRLNEQAVDGWSVVAIVPTGNTVTAYLSRPTEGTPAEAAPAADVAAAAAVGAAASDETVANADDDASTPDDTASVDDSTPDHVGEATGWAAGAAAGAAATAGETSESSTTDSAPTAAPAAEPAAEPAQAASAATSGDAAAPAGWYADPSSRFELRYWDGAQWTEHVSRSGQQYTDPPVA